ncbi:TetR family transcriptional regulator [Amycolatopsis saalfeldensis]|uniref:Transcriptional repressor C-terminal n=1 Tax=Amycolatopsis saalfeldensis TaxID=394193 RepID=A0A1H8XH18_9PSEU|nr:TetR family transcriptional regulator [Amycolatopsis saalfeldensis]SEP39123.1 transcriptional repressor C-terminal [Amycolatopsis saalfeldensis]
MTEAAAPRKTRRRGEDLVHAVYTATVEQLCSVGYARLSMEGIAAAAGTGKAALYRRWSSLDELVRDTLGDMLPSPPEVAGETTLRAGMIELVSYLNAALFDSKRAAFQAVAAHSGEDTSMLRELFRERVLDPCQDRLLELMKRRGVDAGPRNARIASVAPAMVMYDCTLGRPMLTAAELESIVDDVLLPLAGGGVTTVR